MVPEPASADLAKPEFAHYYGDWFWDDSLTGWVKSLLLFFDGIALALPAATAARLVESRPVLAQPLADLGLLRNYPPDLWLGSPWWLSSPWTMRAPGLLNKVRRAQRLLLTLPEDSLLFLESVDNALEAGQGGEPEFGESLAKYDRALAAAKWEHGQSPGMMRALSVGVTSRLLWRSVTDVAIRPVINDESAGSFVASIIGSHDRGLARIVTSDLARVGIDLGTVPLDEVLGFRRQHGAEYRAYAGEVRQFALALSLMPEAERPYALADRRAALEDKAEELRRIARASFMRGAVSLGFGVAGAAWTLAHGDTWGALFAAGAAAAGLPAAAPEPIGAAYTYICLLYTSPSP